MGIAIVGCLTLIVAGRSGRRKWLEKKEAERRRKAEAERRLKREQLLKEVRDVAQTGGEIIKAIAPIVVPIVTKSLDKGGDSRNDGS